MYMCIYIYVCINNNNNNKNKNKKKKNHTNIHMYVYRQIYTCILFVHESQDTAGFPAAPAKLPSAEPLQPSTSPESGTLGSI